MTDVFHRIIYCTWCHTIRRGADGADGSTLKNKMQRCQFRFLSYILVDWFSHQYKVYLDYSPHTRLMFFHPTWFCCGLWGIRVNVEWWMDIDWQSVKHLILCQNVLCSSWGGFVQHFHASSNSAWGNLLNWMPIMSEKFKGLHWLITSPLCFDAVNWFSYS